MENDIYLQAEKLKDSLKADSRVIHLEKLEKKMNENEEVMLLAYKKDVAASEYSDTLNHFSDDSEEVKKARQKLHEAKTDLDMHPLVKEYLAAYKEVRELYDEINEVLFGGFTANLCPKE